MDKKPAAAERAISFIQQGAERLLDFPELGHPMPEDTERRELFLPFGASAYVHPAGAPRTNSKIYLIYYS